MAAVFIMGMFAGEAAVLLILSLAYIVGDHKDDKNKK